MTNTDQTARPRHDQPETHGATKVLHDARDRASSALAGSRDSVKDVASRASETIETNPLGVVAGGIALGVLAGALIPRSAKEKELLAPIGRRIGETADRAVRAAREAGAQELDQRGLTKDAAKDRGRELVDGVVHTLSTATHAALSSTKKGSGLAVNGPAPGKADTASTGDGSSTEV